VHTPASHDFLDKKIGFEKIIEKAVEAGLDGIAITDHNTVLAIDEIKRKVKGSKLTIFPGFEISCHGAKEGPIHVIGIFDPSKTQSDLERVLGKLELKKEGEESLTQKSVSDVVNIIRESEGLPVLAHANSTHGALSDIRGNPRIDLVKNPSLIGVEATETDFKKPDGSRLIDFLNGEDTHYRRKLAVYCSSDNPASKGTGHSADTIGSHFTYFRMGELTIESLRQCFEDPDTRIIQFNENGKLQTQQPRILEMKIEGGFLNGLKVIFHSGMNSIIGGTGTGKSLLIEFLRFAFNKLPHKDLQKEHQSKLEKQLRDKGVVTVRFVDLSGEEYEISRTYNARKPQDSAVVCKNCTTGKKFLGDVNSIFPILFYSQNEVLEVTRDKKAQLDLLDNFRDFERLKQEIDGIVTELHTLDRSFATSFEVSAGLSSLKKQEQTFNEKIKKLEKQLKSKAAKEFSDFNNLEERRNSAVESSEILNIFDEKVKGAIDDIKAEGKTLFQNVTNLESPEKEVVAHLQKTHNDLIGVLVKASNVIDVGTKAITTEIKSWEKSNKYLSKKKAYEKSVKTKSKLDQIETERQKLIGERDKIKRGMAAAQRAQSEISEIRKKRSGLLKKLQDFHSESFKEREEQARLITQRSSAKLKINVHRQANNQKYVKNLSDLKVKSYAEEKEIEAIVNNLPVVDFVEAILDRNYKKIATAANLTEAKAEGIVNVLLQSENLSKTLSLQYASYPDDLIEILYRKQDGSYHPLSELSMGQKADGLLMIALGDSQLPVIIDQPEDALDLSSIWDDVCQRLRTSKHLRQFVFTTHNSSVAVASDSDQYIVMEADAKKGWVSKTGSIDQFEVKSKVIEHLEGGTRSYNLKRKKYNIKVDS